MHAVPPRTSAGLTTGQAGSALQAGVGQPAGEVRGFLAPFFETGTEGVVWSLDDPGLPGYDSLHPLMNGDELRVLDDAGGTLWEGVVRLDRTTGLLPHYPGGEPVQQAVLGYWVHGLQEGMDPEAWGRLFFEGRRAVLREVGFRPYPSEPHPFSGLVEGLRARLAVLPEARAREVFRNALHHWLFVRLDGEWSSLTQGWGLGLDETLALLGQLAPYDARARAPRPNGDRETPMPFSLPLLERLGVLFGLNAALLWGLRDEASRAAWLRAANARLEGGSPLDLLFGGGTEGVRRVLEAARACLDDGGERG